MPLINLCQHPGCERRAENKTKPGLCDKHKKRRYRHGCSYFKRGASGPCSRLHVVKRRVTSYYLTSVNGVTMYVHRVLAELELGRSLRREEQVHHMDGNGLNNRKDNREILMAGEHGAVSASRKDSF